MIIPGCSESKNGNLFGMSCGAIPEGTNDLILEEYMFSKVGALLAKKQACSSVGHVSDFRIVGVWVLCRVELTSCILEYMGPDR